MPLRNQFGALGLNRDRKQQRTDLGAQYEPAAAKTTLPLPPFAPPGPHMSPPPGGKAVQPPPQPSQSIYDMTKVLTATVIGGLAILFFRGR